MTINTFDPKGLIEPGSILIQLKATEVLRQHADKRSYCFRLDVRDYNLWIAEPNLVFLIVYEARSRRAYWLYCQQYLKGADAPKPRANAKTIQIRIPQENRVRTDFIRHARNLKTKVLKKLVGADIHG